LGRRVALLSRCHHHTKDAQERDEKAMTDTRAHQTRVTRWERRTPGLRRSIGWSTGCDTPPS